ncbi:MAG: sigma factor-like helix-turn-helix DNA-binding protein [Egibacteraceae bacterium]
MPDKDTDRPRGRDVARSSHDYGRCPRCELVTPLVLDCTSGDKRLGIEPVYSGALRCGLCARALVEKTAAPLDFRRDCPDCGSVMLGPADAVVIACPGCDAYFLNPANSPEVRARVDATLAERARLAEMVAALDKRIAEADAHFDFQRWEESVGYVPHPGCAQQTAGLYGEVGPCVFPLGHIGSCSMYPCDQMDREFGPTWVPQEWIDRSRPFAETFAEAVRGVVGEREQRVVMLRYGLDGNPGRTFREIALDLGRSPSRARSLLKKAVNQVRASPLRNAPRGPLERRVRTADEIRLEALRDSSKWPPERRACGIVVHLATEVLGDVTNADAPARIRAFVDQALPNSRVQVATQLLIELASIDLDVLRGGRDRALFRATAAARG